MGSTCSICRKRLGRRVVCSALVALLATAVLATANDAPAALSAEDVLDRVRTAWQGESFHAIVRLEITFAGATKRHALEVWTLGDDYALLRVLEPIDDAGSGYLQIKQELWYYAPAAGAAIQLPSMLLGDALFGAGPSLADLALDTLSDDFDVTADAVEGGTRLSLVPHPDAPVVYGKLELTVTDEYVITQLVTYDQRGGVVRTATFSDVVEQGGRRVPTRVVVDDASGDRTVQQIVDPEFDLDLDAAFFTIERLESGR